MSFDLHGVNAETPILLLFDGIGRLVVHLQKLYDIVIHRDSSETADIGRFDRRLYLQWDTDITLQFTFSELRRLHCRFGHPHVDKLVNVLKGADISTITAEKRRLLEKI